MTSQMELDLSPDGTKMDRVIARLMQADAMHPVSLLDFDRRVYGTSVDRFIRFARERLKARGIEVESLWKETVAGVRYKIFWCQPLGTARADQEIEARKARAEQSR